MKAFLNGIFVGFGCFFIAKELTGGSTAICMIVWIALIIVNILFISPYLKK